MPCKFIKPHEYSSFSFEEGSSELLLPFPVEKPAFQIDSTAYEKPCSNDTEETCCQTNSSNLSDDHEDFDAESMLDEEIGEGVIDSIMGNLNVCSEGESTTSFNGAVVGRILDRIRQEVGVFAAKIDVAEELARLNTHLDELERVLKKGGAVGKRLDFLMQELNREANTLASKSVSAEITVIALDLKLAIEQMREQVQNLE